MIRNRDGIAGFFEDLPVLMFVLVGVSVLVMSASWVHRERAERGLEDRLDGEARNLAKEVVASVHSDRGVAPRVASFQGRNLSSLGVLPLDSLESVVTVAVVHPGHMVLLSNVMGLPSGATRTGYAEVLFNGVDDHGFVVILEVQVIVWQKG